MSEISSSAKGVTVVPGESMAAAGPFAGNAKESPVTPKPAMPKVDKAFFERLPLETCFICDIRWLHHLL
jgi:hypothetical protein